MSAFTTWQYMVIAKVRPKICGDTGAGLSGAMSCLQAPRLSSGDGPTLGNYNHPLGPAGTVDTSGLLGLSPGPPLPGMASPSSEGGSGPLQVPLAPGCITGQLPPPHPLGPSTLPLAHSSNCDRHFCMFICSGFDPGTVAALMTKVTDTA